jgi:hypothetical protein
VVVISDGQGNPLQGALVTGDFSGTLNETGAIGTTDSSGSATIDTAGTAKGNLSLTFCITKVDASVFTDTCGT